MVIRVRWAAVDIKRSRQRLQWLRLHAPKGGAWIQSLAGKLDLTCCNEDTHSQFFKKNGWIGIYLISEWEATALCNELNVR